MRNIVVDIGNTRTKLGVFEQGKLTARFDEWSEEVVRTIGKRSGDNVILSAVGHVEEEVRLQLSAYDHYLEFNRSVKLPLVLDYKTPETLGLDRMAAAVGALVLFPDSEVLILDMGSCITADLLSADGVFRGGTISPGVSMRFRAMHEFTDRLPTIDWVAQGSFSKELPGRSTHECMEAGVLRGVQFELEGYIHRYQSTNPRLKVVMTGGDARYFENIINTPIFTEDSLVLIGLNRVLEYNVV